MLPFPRSGMQVFSIWTIASMLTFFANPGWPFGWVEVVASVGPLILGVDRRIRRELVFVLGLPAIAWLCLLDPSVPVVPRLLVASAAFAIGVLLASRMIAERISPVPSQASAFDDFQRTLEKEFGRARRHERGFAILSLAVDSRSLPADGARGRSDEAVRESTEHRRHVELAGLLAGELHVYSEVVVAPHRVLALVPEVEGVAADALVKRVQSVIARELDFDVQVGVACFPRDAVCVDTLIDAADRNRKNPKLHRVPDRAADLDREVLG